MDAPWHGKAKDSGITVDVRQVSAHRVMDGKIIEFTTGSPDVTAAFKAVGLEE